MIFIFLPLSAILFEKMMLSLLFESIETSIEINTYQIYQTLEIDALSQGALVLSDDTLNNLEELLMPLMKHPQLEGLQLLSITQEKDEIVFKGKINLRPSLYRSMYGFEGEHEFNYFIETPLDKKRQ
jgi:hypothetical protein